MPWCSDINLIEMWEAAVWRFRRSMQKKRVLKALALVIAFWALCVAANAQTASPTPCADNCVTISREAAIKAVETAKELDAMKVQKIADDKAFEDLRRELNDIRVKFAAVSGELSGVKQAQVRDAAIIELLLKSAKKQCKPFAICIL